MNGYMMTFYSHQGRTIEEQPVGEWLVHCGKALNLSGVTLKGGIMSYGHDGDIHAQNLYDTYDQPVQVTFVVSEEERTRLMEKIEAASCKLFYTQHPVEFGHTL